MPIHPTVLLSQKLIQIESVTPSDNGCQKLLAGLLNKAGFTVVHKRFGKVDNLFAYHGKESNKSKNIMFAGHTDVVPTGNIDSWACPPFSAQIKKGYLYGRGAADMKSAVAAFTHAMIDFVENNPDHNGKIALMLTSDEEGPAKDGIKKMMPFIAKTHQFDYCIVGEPSSSSRLGDVARIGRRGSLHVTITIHGKQGHVAYPENAENPIFKAAGFIDELATYQWDQGSQDFGPTSFQISSVKTSSQTSNIIPADLIIQANFRYNPESDKLSIQKQLTILLTKFKLKHSLQWDLSGLPFHSKNTNFKNIVSKSIKEITGITPDFNTAGGTSDGRFIAPFGVNVVELGVINKTIHQINENVFTQDIIDLQQIYFKIIDGLLD